jgi:hypothetical protein
MKAPLCVVATTLTILSSCSSRTLGNRDTEVLSVLVEQVMKAQRPARSDAYVVVLDRTARLCGRGSTETPTDSCMGLVTERAVGRLPDDQTRLRAAFNGRNGTSLMIPKIPGPYTRMTEPQIVSQLVSSSKPSNDPEPYETFRANQWAQFFAKYPNSLGYLQFSAPAYSNDGGTALVYMGYFARASYSKGWLVRLTRSTNGWRETAEIQLWIV